MEWASVGLTCFFFLVFLACCYLCCSGVNGKDDQTSALTYSHQVDYVGKGYTARP